MKKSSLLYYFAGLMSCYLLSACDKDYLEQPSEDQVEAPYFFNTAKDLEVATNDFYSMLATTSVYTEDASSDNLMPLNPSDRVKGNRIVPVASGSGGWSWGNLRKINYFLANYHRANDQEAKDKYSGIERFFRDYYYYDKVKTFGDVTWYSGVSDAKDKKLYKPRDTRALVMVALLADFDYAMNNILDYNQMYLIT